MRLRKQTGRIENIKSVFEVETGSPDDYVIALAGNPNTGKSTVFNSLAGLNQHTGNWPGKTVNYAQGKYVYEGIQHILVDLPGTYSLMANSADEEAARDFICLAGPHATVVVTDATCVERNLNMVLQVMEITDRVVVCVNLLDEAKRKNIKVDLAALSSLLGVPVVGTNAREGQGLNELKEAVYQVASGSKKNRPIRVVYDQEVENAIGLIEPLIKDRTGDEAPSRWLALRFLEGDNTAFLAYKNLVRDDCKEKSDDLATLSSESSSMLGKQMEIDDFRDRVVGSLVKLAEDIGGKTVYYKNEDYNRLDHKIDSVVTSKIWGIPIMLAMLGLVFWLTIQGANYPSEALAAGFFWIEERLTQLFVWAGWPDWLYGALVLGVYRTLAWVVSVMLPPMAIFFPLFTLLEDSGYLPRIAFNLDNFFKKACSHGKQALTMCMGFGCNAAGVVACRIIDSPRERLIATITNNFVPCNGRFPTLIALAMIFIAGTSGPCQSILASLSITGVIVLGVVITLSVSKVLSKTVLKGLPSSFTLELPPYRKPLVGRVLVRSIYDRTLFVLARAVVVAAPAGLIIWILANVQVRNTSILQLCAQALDPFAYYLGLDGYILLAFILGFPANEIVIPIIIMSYMATGSLIELESLSDLRNLLVYHGWTWLTGVCTMLFCLNHFPCGTTMLTIFKETRSKKWSLLAFLVPTVTGITICFLVAQTARLLGLV
ncbi:MAG: ferrous iron transport protein B [Syntrophomonas sp.]